ncbi:substrate-binding domain-containing protein [Mameliella sp.]|uniref:substrate-binding domain-containing protein n=1 Tax=Mameliella sp. TaxID=1924940 RepID=UPI003BAAAD65
MRTLFAIFVALNALLVVLLLIYFGAFAPRIALHVLSDPANRTLEPALLDWAEDNNAELSFTYRDSAEIARDLSDGAVGEFDAVWPSDSLWLTLGKNGTDVRLAAAIHHSPVVLALRNSTASAMGWTGRDDLTLQEIREAAGDGKFRLAMPSATQSGTGVATYLGMWHSLSGTGDALTAEHLADETLRDDMRALLDQMSRTSGGSGPLTETLVANVDAFDALFASEAQVITANRQLAAKGVEPLQVFYLPGAQPVLEAPLGLLTEGDEDKQDKFLELQTFLGSREARILLSGLGWRAGSVAEAPTEAPDTVDTSIWNPDWGIDPTHSLTPVPRPEAPVITEALALYDKELRKPSLTVWVLDVSDAMSGQPIADLKEALTGLLQPSPQDVNIVIPYNHNILDPMVMEGEDAATVQSALRQFGDLQATGGMDMYYAVYEAFEAMTPYVVDDAITGYRPRIVVLAAGPSDTESRISLLAYRDQTAFARNVPIQVVAFADADAGQLAELSNISSGRLFRVEGDLQRALRQAGGL